MQVKTNIGRPEGNEGAEIGLWFDAEAFAVLERARSRSGAQEAAELVAEWAELLVKSIARLEQPHAHAEERS